jgi:myosin light chain 6
MEDIEDYREAFMLFDTKGDGSIGSEDIGNILRALGTNPTNEDVNKIITEIDPSGDKRISFEEFIPLLNAQSKKKMGGSFEHFVEAFRIFDRDNNAMVSAAEIRHLLSSLGEKLTSEEVDTLVSGMEDTAGMINYEEFVRQIIES